MLLSWILSTSWSGDVVQTCAHPIDETSSTNTIGRHSLSH